MKRIVPTIVLILFATSVVAKEQIRPADIHLGSQASRAVVSKTRDSDSPSVASERPATLRPDSPRTRLHRRHSKGHVPLINRGAARRHHFEWP
jgi:hypothetical protein